MTMTDERRIAGVSRAELERRWSLVREHMREQGLDAIVAVSNDDHLGGTTRWFTDFPVNYRRAVLFWPEGPMTVVDHGHIGTRRTLAADEALHLGVGELLFTAEFQSVPYSQAYEAELAVEALKGRAARRIGLVNPGGMPHAFAGTLKRDLAGATSVDVSDAIDGFMVVKSAEEIGLIRQAAAMQDAVFAAVLREARPGMRDLDISAVAQFEGRKLGAETGILLVGSAPAGTASPMRFYPFQGRTIRPGDQLCLLIENNGPGGYYTEMIRHISFGAAPKEMAEAFEVTRRIQVALLAEIRPGVACRDLYDSYARMMAAEGHVPDRRVFAHGQGYNLVERPLIRFDETMTIQAGMNLAVHPTIVTPAVFVASCDNFLVGEGGVERLHRTEQRIFEL